MITRAHASSICVAALVALVVSSASSRAATFPDAQAYRYTRAMAKNKAYTAVFEPYTDPGSASQAGYYWCDDDAYTPTCTSRTPKEGVDCSSLVYKVWNMPDPSMMGDACFRPWIANDTYYASASCNADGYGSWDFADGCAGGCPVQCTVGPTRSECLRSSVTVSAMMAMAHKADAPNGHVALIYTVGDGTSMDGRDTFINSLIDGGSAYDGETSGEASSLRTVGRNTYNAWLLAFNDYRLTPDWHLIDRGDWGDGFMCPNSCNCKCANGAAFGNVPIPKSDTYCGFTVCGNDNQLYQCSGNTWWAIGGGPCNSKCVGGFDYLGHPINPDYTYIGYRACGGWNDPPNRIFTCSATGWVDTGAPCP